MRTSFKAALFFNLALVFSSSPARAQFDPRPPLGQLITALQFCGPSQAYQILSPQLLSLIAAQTNNSGCYATISAAGPIVNMIVIDQRFFPVGPIYVVRVTFQSGSQADWFMGINQYTNRVEYLTFQAAAVGMAPPQIGTGPTNPQINTGPLVKPSTPVPDGGNRTPDTGNGCDLYPVMCQ